MIYFIAENSVPEPAPSLSTFLMYLAPLIIHEVMQLNERMTATERHDELSKQLISLFGQDKDFSFADLFTITNKNHYLKIEYSDNKSKSDALIRKYQQLPGDLIMSILAVFLANKLESGRIIYEKNQIIVKLKNNQASPSSLNADEFIQQLKNMLLCHKFLMVVAKKLCGSRTIELKETSLCLPTSKEIQHKQLTIDEQEILLEDSVNKAMVIINFAKESTLEKINAYFLSHKNKAKPVKPEARQHNEPVINYITNNLFIDIAENKAKKEKVKTRKPWASLPSFWSAAPVLTSPQAPEVHDFGEFGVYNSNNNNTDDSTVIRKVETKYGAIYVRAKSEDIPAEIFQSMHLANRRMGVTGLILTLDHPKEAFKSMPVFAKFKDGNDIEYIATLAYKLETSSNQSLPLIIFNHCTPHNRTTQWPKDKEAPITILTSKEEVNTAAIAPA